MNSLPVTTAEAYAGCVSGAIPKDDYLRLIRETGFSGIEVAVERRIEVPEDLLASHLSPERRREAQESDLHVLSVTVTATKPA